MSFLHNNNDNYKGSGTSLGINGHYDETGHWQRTKFCFVPCMHCDCGPPGGLNYNAQYDKAAQAQKKDGPTVTLRLKTAEEMAQPPKPFGDPTKITREGDKVILDLREKEAMLRRTTDPEEERWTAHLPCAEYLAEGITHARCSDGLWIISKHGLPERVDD